MSHDGLPTFELTSVTTIPTEELVAELLTRSIVGVIALQLPRKGSPNTVYKTHMNLDEDPASSKPQLVQLLSALQDHFEDEYDTPRTLDSNDTDGSWS